jgi:hypothetical protein
MAVIAAPPLPPPPPIDCAMIAVDSSPTVVMLAALPSVTAPPVLPSPPAPPTVTPRNALTSVALKPMAADNAMPQKLELIRSTEEEKQSQLKRLREFQKKNQDDCGPMLERLRQAVIKDENVFAVLMDAVRVCSLGQITHALFEVGGQYRRSM